MTASFATLGNVEARVGGRMVDVGHPRQRCVLAALLFDANRPVSADQLIGRVWGDEPLPHARGTLHTYLSRLRKSLAGAPEVRILRQAGGYTLTVDPLAVDVHRLRHLITRARESDDPDDAVRLLEAALALGRGDFCAGMDTPWLAAVRESLDQERTAADLELTDLKLRRGRHTELVAELAARTAQRPLDERLAGQFMLALTRCGRPADALGHYQKTRGLLADELGTDPGTALQELHQRILAADPALTGAANGGPAPPTPRQLPAPPRLFTGRAAELARLTELRRHGTEASGPVVLGVIGGGGVGKTWLALRWAHDHVDEFPDGQLFVDLHGFAPAGVPLPVTVAMRGLLQALGVAPGAIPAEPHAQTGLYRSLVTGKRILVVLDNARDTTQVVPLLPGSPTCVVMITSRHRLTGLAVGHGAGTLSLDVFDAADATTLLARCAGPGRVAAEPDATAALVDRCGRLPLALGIVAARAATHPGFPLATLAAELGESDRLDALATGELTANVRTVLSSSQHALDAQAATLLGLLGLVPGPDIGVPAAASLLGLPASRTRALLQELLAVHLVHEHHSNRYRMHDLVRLYAAERAAADHPADFRAAALLRLTDYYLRTASAATDVIIARERHPRPSPAPAPAIGSYDEAMTWLETERPNLLALAHDAARRDQPAVLGELSRALRHYLDLRGFHEDARTLHTAALAAARTTGDRGLEAHALVALGLVQWRWGRYTRAATQFRGAVTVAHQHGHLDIEGYALHYLGSTAARLGRYEMALGYHRQSLALGRTIGDHDIEGCNLDALGIVYWYLGDYERALDHTLQGLALAQRTGNVYVEAHALNNLGLIHHRTGNQDHARNRFEQALALARGSGNRYVESNALNGLGFVYRELGDDQRARAHIQHALEVARETGNRSHEAEILNNLGELARHTGDPAAALEHHQQALAITRATGEPLEQATAHHHLGNSYADLGRPDRAHHHQQIARALHADLGLLETQHTRN
ncbi:AfsR/SARP family transcriptional regulator [Amycolatopsis anabasis]|uniref:AfsR/SARP family transcriptional regulator n=1 Tax=Amycolatopsis anabasis TaxID=1840409 RepID=UPI00131B1AEC|nr:tetratricopeptide repeat protein [Amycolatopsis anabasis]